MTTKRLLALVLTLSLALTMLAGCGGAASSAAPSSTPAPAASGDGSQASSEAAPAASPADLKANLTLYTSEPEELVTEMIADFNKTYPNVKIDLFRSGTGKVTAKMDAELETGSTEANIIWFADIGYIKGLDDKGQILHYTPKGAESIDQQYAYNNGMGHEVRLIYNVLAYNTTKVQNPPKDWNDVTDPAYKSTFAMANPNYSGGAFTALVVHVQNADKVGWDFYKNAKANDCKYEESNGNLQTKVSSGEYGAVAIVDFMGRNAKADGSPVDVVYPASGAVLIPTPISLMNNIPAEEVPAAQAFLDYMFEVNTQKLFIAQGYIPVVEAAGVPEGAPAAKDIVTMPFDLDYYVANSTSIREEYVKLFGE